MLLLALLSLLLLLETALSHQSFFSLRWLYSRVDDNMDFSARTTINSWTFTGSIFECVGRSIDWHNRGISSIHPNITEREKKRQCVWGGGVLWIHISVLFLFVNHISRRRREERGGVIVLAHFNIYLRLTTQRSRFYKRNIIRSAEILISRFLFRHTCLVSRLPGSRHLCNQAGLCWYYERLK